MNYEFIGWKYSVPLNSDKVWGIIRLEKNDNPQAEANFIVFWGRRGSQLRTEHHRATGIAMQALARKKQKRNGYETISEQKLQWVYPEFEEELRKTVTWATLMP
jgi:hypothetical protein